ncbi:hypothetical protein FF38_05475 [Lucilia cuprina]|uniref:Uncharacterized protein n=1 Tax=Lucilia cuprina TaxID=7375 RepID=A0A0L0C0M7_LUCCU|nr:hypothetical protein FF38_05475 [Lucilia cuprina]
MKFDQQKNKTTKNIYFKLKFSTFSKKNFLSDTTISSESLCKRSLKSWNFTFKSEPTSLALVVNFLTPSLTFSLIFSAFCLKLSPNFFAPLFTSHPIFLKKSPILSPVSSALAILGPMPGISLKDGKIFSSHSKRSAFEGIIRIEFKIYQNLRLIHINKNYEHLFSSGFKQISRQQTVNVPLLIGSLIE